MGWGGRFGWDGVRAVVSDTSSRRKNVPKEIAQIAGVNRSHRPRQTNAAFQSACSTTTGAKPHSALGDSENRPVLFHARAATVTAIPVHGRCPNGVTALRCNNTL
jgi:hypothetical protein